MSEPDAEVERFWATARDGARLTSLPGYLPATSLEMVPPPTWSFRDDASGDELLGLVLAGTKTATSSALEAYEAEGEPLPEVGTLGIVVDSTGRPRALVETTSVEVVALGDVRADHALAEGEGDGSLAHWRAEHERFFRDQGVQVSPATPVVLERIRVLVRA